MYEYDENAKKSCGGGDDIDIWVWFLKAIIALTAQKNCNVINTSGNNNEIQVPNESGPGGNIQV